MANKVRKEQEPRRQKRVRLQRRPEREVQSHMQADIENILARLETEIPEAKKAMDELLTRLRTTRLRGAA